MPSEFCPVHEEIVEQQKDSFRMIREIHTAIMGDLTGKQPGILQRLSNVETEQINLREVRQALAWRFFDAAVKAIPWIILLILGAYGYSAK